MTEAQEHVPVVAPQLDLVYFVPRFAVKCHILLSILYNQLPVNI